VNVHTSKTVRSIGPDLGMPLDELFRQFFSGTPPGMPRGGREGVEREVRSLGTGFVISKDGLVLTNNHVVDDVERITVVFQDETEASAKIVGQDPKTDLALIRIEKPPEIQPLPLGDSDDLLPGDWVVAIGNPFGLDHTVTAGIVSATGRNIGQGPYDDFIQTDAAINPGNSGGPLLNLKGQVVGINTAINPQANTIGFAVPINLAKEIIPQLEKSGKVTRGWLGVNVQMLTPELARALEIDATEGALVAQVLPDSPAVQAGIERGDVIVRFAGQDIRRMRDLSRAVARAPIGERAELELLRGKQRKTLAVKIEALPDEDSGPRAASSGGSLADLGLQARDLTPELRERLGVRGTGGALIAEIDPEGAAAQAGLEEGDVVLELNRERVRDADDLAQKIARSESSLLFLIQRGGHALYLVMPRP